MTKGRRGAYARRNLEMRDRDYRERIESIEAHERWTARRVQMGCDEFFKSRDIKYENHRWHSR